MRTIRKFALVASVLSLAGVLARIPVLSNIYYLSILLGSALSLLTFVQQLVVQKIKVDANVTAGIVINIMLCILLSNFPAGGFAFSLILLLIEVSSYLQAEELLAKNKKDIFIKVSED